MLHAWDVDLLIQDLLGDLRGLTRFCVGLCFLHSGLDSHCLRFNWISKASKLVGKDKVHLTILFELVSGKSDLRILQLSYEGHSPSQIKHISSMVPPSLLVKPIVEVLVHVLLSVFIPGLFVVVEVPFVNFRDLEFLPKSRVS